ncbi:unnamed protein product [Anisakis simplex]|uniref:F-box domain-containing protein n=1 Tax=Anisakis simplex TaxID=6269 RepID=A0A3P6QCE7_ANISI|nr:unnamed protein product [Anisakis simplex]
MQDSICEYFSNVECCIEKTPCLSEPPFNFAFDNLGRKLHLLPSGTALPKDFHLIASLPEGDVISDQQAAETVHLVVAGGNDWCTPIQRVFNKTHDSAAWALLVLELRSGNAHFEILSRNSKPATKSNESTILWLLPICMEPPQKPRTVKKILVKKSPEKTTTASSGSVTRVTKTPNGTKIVRKKIIVRDEHVSVTGTEKSESIGTKKKINDNMSISDKNDSDIISSIDNNNTSNCTSNKSNEHNGSSTDKNAKSREVAKKTEQMNTDRSGIDSGVSLTDSDNEKSQKNDLSALEESNDRDTDKNEWVTPCTTPDPGLQLIETDKKYDTKENAVDISTSFTIALPTNETTSHQRMNSENIPEKVMKNDETSTADEERSSCESAQNRRHMNACISSDERCSPTLSSTSSRLSPPSDVSERVIPKQKLVNNNDSIATFGKEIDSNFRRTSTLHDSLQRNDLLRTDIQMPVQVLQQVLKKLTFKELGELRRVHPHWDELCGQALNSGYYEIVKKADKMLTECQRRVRNERQLHNVLALLTNLQVHILNPIDILRPAMDEGVCCFVYGKLLDKIFAIVLNAKRMMNGEYDLEVDWKSVADLAREAQIHYKTNLEAVMEEKLSDVVRLKALQRIQRIDSFIVDSTVVKLENHQVKSNSSYRAAHMARDDLEWEIEQLRQQNSQLRKDNRDLKKDYMRLESRVEMLENKFKTMARLLQ